VEEKSAIFADDLASCSIYRPLYKQQNFIQIGRTIGGRTDGCTDVCTDGHWNQLH